MKTGIIFSILSLFFLPLFAEVTLVSDTLSGETIGLLDGTGEFLPEGGWRSTGGKIVYDAGYPVSNGLFEVQMGGWTAPAQGVDKSHPLSGWEYANAFNHWDQSGCFWNWRIGTGYNPFKVLARADSQSVREEARVGENAKVNAADSHLYRVTWDSGTVAFYFDGVLLQSWTFDRFVLQYFTIGRDDWYRDITNPAPVFSTLRIVDRDSTLSPPDTTVFPPDTTHTPPDTTQTPPDTTTAVRRTTSPNGPNAMRLAIYPNPGNPHFRIQSAHRPDSRPEPSIVDVTGRRVRTSLKPEIEKQDQTVWIWDGRNDAGDPVAGGIYIVTLRTSTQRLSRRLILLR